MIISRQDIPEAAVDGKKDPLQARLVGQNHPWFKPVVLSGYNHPGQYSLKWSILVGVVDWNFQAVMTDILGHVSIFIFKRKESKWTLTVSSPPRVLIISF